MQEISSQVGSIECNPMRLGATAPNLRNRRGMRDAHLTLSCCCGLKLRFARRPMTASGLRPFPTDWEGCFAAWENWESCGWSLVWNGLEISKDFPISRRRFPNQPGTAKGRATGTTTHEARFNVAWATTQTREARSRLFPCFGAVAPKTPLFPRS